MENVAKKLEQMPTPDEELKYLHEQYKSQLNQNQGGDHESLAQNVVKNYVVTAPKELFGTKHTINETVIAGIVLKLSPEPHDTRMEELFRTIEGKGVYTALKIVEKMQDAHLEDDFHRFISELIREGHGIKGLKEKTELGRSVRRTLFEIEIPKIVKDTNANEQTKNLYQKMESVFLSLQSETGGRETVVLELANSAGAEHVTFFASVPVAWANRFENQVKVAYPDAKVKESSNDFNIFSEQGAISISTASLDKSNALPIKVFNEQGYDPMNQILGAFGKLNKTTEGALVQIVYGPTSSSITNEIQHKKDRISKGENPREVLRERGVVGGVFSTLGELFKKSKSNTDKEGEEAKARQKYGLVLEKIDQKLSRPILPVWLRVAASAGSLDRAESIRMDIEASFKQFLEPTGNSLVFKKIKKHDYKKAVRTIAFRLSSYGDSFALNSLELATIFHFSSAGLTSSPTLKTAKSVSRLAPIDLIEEGILLGVNGEGNEQRKIYLSDADRLRHLYVIGQTGTGKSTLLKNIVIQDIERGHGVCFIDPHGSDIDEILTRIPESRRKDVIYFDPANLERPMALNMLEFDERFPEQKTFVVNELFAIFQKLYGAVPESMGPMFEQYFRNATLLTIEDPESGSTLLHVSKVLSDKAYREYKLEKCKNPVVTTFWRDIAAKAGGEASLENIVPYITSKFDVFLANDYMRPIVSQQKSSLRFREILDQRKILLVNLSKGRLGEINSNLLGLIIVGKLLMAALSRVDIKEGEREQFNLVIDEFQNVTTNSIATIFSEARKYKLSLTVAHQYIAQLSEDISKAVFGNVGSLSVFRVGNDDAEYLEKQFSPLFTRNDLANLPNGICAIKLLSQGVPKDPFDMTTFYFEKGSMNTQSLKTESAEKYGQPRELIENIISQSFNK